MGRLRDWRTVRQSARLKGDRALADRQALLSVGRAIVDGEYSLARMARSMEVDEHALAAALTGVFGMVPAPPDGSPALTDPDRA